MSDFPKNPSGLEEGQREYSEVKDTESLSEKEVGDRAVIVNTDAKKDFRDSSDMETDWRIERFMPGHKILVTRGEGDDKEGREIDEEEFRRINFKGSEEIVDALDNEYKYWAGVTVVEGSHIDLKKQEESTKRIKGALVEFEKGNLRPSREILYDKLVKNLKEQGRELGSGSLDEISDILDEKKQKERARIVREYNQAGKDREKYQAEVGKLTDQLEDIVRQIATREEKVPNIELLKRKGAIEGSLDRFKSSRDDAIERFNKLQEILKDENYDYGGREEDKLLEMIQILDREIEKNEQNE